MPTAWPFYCVMESLSLSTVQVCTSHNVDVPPVDALCACGNLAPTRIIHKATKGRPTNIYINLIS